MRQNNRSRVDGHRLLDHLVRPVSEPRQQQGLRIRRAAYGLAERPGFLEIAAGERIKQYYVAESVGIASGILLTALHHAGLATLTHTPNPMGFLRSLLGRPTNERAVMIVVAGYPAKHAKVPDVQRKALADIASFVE